MYKSIPSFRASPSENTSTSASTDVEVVEVGSGVWGALNLVVRRVREAVAPSKKQRKSRSRQGPKSVDPGALKARAIELPKDQNVAVRNIQDAAQSASEANNRATGSLMHRVLMERDWDQIRWMLQNQVSPNVRDAQGRTVLHIACSDPDVPALVVRYLLEGGADVHLVDARGRTPLHTVLLTKPIDQMKMQLLIKANASMEKTDGDGVSPSMLFFEKMPGLGSMDGWIAKQNAHYLETGVPNLLLFTPGAWVKRPNGGRSSR